MLILKGRERRKELKFLLRVLERGTYIEGLDDQVTVKDVNCIIKTPASHYAVAYVHDGVIDNLKTYRDFKQEVHRKKKKT